MIGEMIGGIAGLVNGMLNRDAVQQANATNWANSLYMAKNSIQMRVADATKAGVHPLYAMGAPTMSFAPAQAGDAGAPVRGLAAGLAGMGQGLDRALGVSTDGVGKLSVAQQLRGNELGLENQELQNQILKQRLASMVAPGTPPGVPAEGEPFAHPSDKPEKTPPLMLGGTRLAQDPETSPMKAWEDRYGDEGPVASALPFLVLQQDLIKHYGPISTWPAQLVRNMYERLSHELQNEGSNFKRFFMGIDDRYPRGNMR